LMVEDLLAHLVRYHAHNAHAPELGACINIYTYMYTYVYINIHMHIYI
jgi:hypothetical protein